MIERQCPDRLPLPVGRLAKRYTAWWQRATMLMALVGIMTVPPVAASEYSVSPMRIALDRDSKSSVVTLTNSGDDRLDFQISVMEWTQDAEGRDQYVPSTDVVFFPKILSLPPGDSRVVRIGVQTIPVAQERTFRLFIEPIATAPRQPLAPGANIAVSLRFALPVFVAPAQREASGVIAKAAFAKGTFTGVLRNTGTVHFRMDDGVSLVGRDAQGAEIFKQQIDARYVLAGISRPVAASVSRSECLRLAKLEVMARTEQFTMSRQLDVDRSSCE